MAGNQRLKHKYGAAAVRVCAQCGTWHEEAAAPPFCWTGKCISCKWPHAIRFASKAEARRYATLRIEEQTGAISVLQTQPEFPISVNGVKCAVYKADFAYFRGHKRIVEDVKSAATKTAVYRLKKKLVEAAYPGVNIVEIETT